LQNYRVLSFQVPLYGHLAPWYGTWLGCALCMLAGLNGVVAAYMAFSVTAMDGDHPFLSRCVVSFSHMVCS